MPNGRKSKLTDEAIQKARDYINGGYAEAGDEIPSVVGMAAHLNVGKTTLYRWRDEQPDRFRDILEDCNDEQHRVLINCGLSGHFNSAITKLVLGKHGYHDRQESDVNLKGDLLDAIRTAQKN